MRKSKTIPLARGLVGGEIDSIYGQLEISLNNYKDVTIAIRRKPYSGNSDIKFSIPSTSLQSIIAVLCEAKEKLDDVWLSKAAVTELKA